MTVLTYRARYRLDIGDSFREPGELAPEAATWFRRDAYVHTGRLVEVQVEPDVLLEAIDTYCPELREEICELSGLTDGIALEGPYHSPRQHEDEISSPAPRKVTATKKPAATKK